jgi:type IV pilus assembly protein PilM
MSILAPIASKSSKRSRALGRRTGWVGVDIGSHSIKFAQVERQGRNTRIASRWSLTGDDKQLLTRETILAGQLSNQIGSMRQMRRMFVRRETACVLPMSVVDFRSIDIPHVVPAEQRQIVGEEMAADLNTESSELVFDYWPLPKESSFDSETDKLDVVCMPQDVASQVVKDLMSSGSECQLLNAMPCAVARAVQIAAPADTDNIICGLNIGFTSSTLVMVRNGIPIFSRLLRSESFRSIIQPLQSSLNLSVEESRQLLAHVGVGVPGQNTPQTGNSIMQRVVGPLDSLITELFRTIEFIHRQPGRYYPSRVCLMGGGGLIKNLPMLLESKLQIPVELWALPDTPSDLSDPLYAVAAALSSLAWDN